MRHIFDEQVSCNKSNFSQSTSTSNRYIYFARAVLSSTMLNPRLCKLQDWITSGLTKNHDRRRRGREQKQSIGEIVLGKSISRVVKSEIFRGHSREIVRNKSTKSGENSPRVGRNNDVTEVTSPPKRKIFYPMRNIQKQEKRNKSFNLWE